MYYRRPYVLSIIKKKNQMSFFLLTVLVVYLASGIEMGGMRGREAFYTLTRLLTSIVCITTRSLSLL